MDGLPRANHVVMLDTRDCRTELMVCSRVRCRLVMLVMLRVTERCKIKD